MRVRQRRARLAPLVHEHVHVRRVRRARASAARHTSIASATCSAGSSASAVTDCGALTITSCAPCAGAAVKRSGAASGSGTSPAARQRGVEVRHDAHLPAGRVRHAAVLAQREQLRRRLVLVALRERVARGVERRARIGAQPRVRPVRPLARDDRPQTRSAGRPAPRSKALLHRDVLDTRLDERCDRAARSRPPNTAAARTSARAARSASRARPPPRGRPRAAAPSRSPGGALRARPRDGSAAPCDRRTAAGRCPARARPPCAPRRGGPRRRRARRSPRASARPARRRRRGGGGRAAASISARSVGAADLDAHDAPA